MQSRLLETVFGSSVVIQRVGDVNQRIYRDSESSDADRGFPKASALELPVSQRFGAEIARVATRLTASRTQQIHGVGPAGKLAIFTFTEASVDRVVPSFEDLAREMVPADVFATAAPRVLGGRIKPGKSELFPKAVCCYMPELTPSGPADPRGALLYAYREARAVVRRHERVRPGSALLWDALRRLVWQHEAAASPQAEPALLPPLPDLGREPGTPGHQIRTLIVTALTQDRDSPNPWRAFVRSLVDAVEHVAGRPLAAIGLLCDRLAFYTDAPRSAGTVRPSIASSVHSAKGENHCATLVLECATTDGRAYDLGPLLPVIAGLEPISSVREVNRTAALTTFVAATRARYLLALAVHQGRARPFLPALSQDGWLVVDL